jgi:predicted nuclease with TOPRIM domain
MAESLEQSIVSLLEDHVELAISTVQELRADKLELEAEIARLNSDVVQRDTEIQRLEARNRDLEEELNLERLAISQERADVRERLEGLMNVLAASNEEASDTDTDEEASDTGTDREMEPDTGPEIAFTVRNDGPNTVVVRSRERSEEE